jgi:hypothetical protein
MATYRGGEIPVPDRVDEDVKRAGPPLPGMENVEEELNLPPEAGPDYVPRPGEKHYMDNQHMARMQEGGPVGRTHDGYPPRQNPDGSHSSEVTVTLTNPRLNEGRPTNVPSLWSGQELDNEDEIVDRVHRSGKIYPYHTSIEDAERSARARSESGGAGVPDMIQNFGQGGVVGSGCKYGSSTVINCKTKDQ